MPALYITFLYSNCSLSSGKELVNIRIIVIIKSISIITDPAEHPAHAADPQPDTSEMPEGTVNIEPAAVVEENQFTNRGPNPGTVQLPPGQELDDISVKKL